MSISCRQYRSTVLLSFLGAIFFCNAASASPPTHYSDLGGTTGLAVSDYTPDAVAQAIVSKNNAVFAAAGTNRRWENLKTCRLDVSVPGVVWFLCSYDICIYPPGSPSYCNPYVMAVYPICGNGGVAPWNGTELYCPPEPGCDAPAP